MNRNWWRRLDSDRGSVFLEYAMLMSLVTFVAISAFSPALLPNGWAGANFGNDFMIRDALIKNPYF